MAAVDNTCNKPAEATTKFEEKKIMPVVKLSPSILYNATDLGILFFSPGELVREEQKHFTSPEVNHFWNESDCLIFRLDHSLHLIHRLY